MLLVLQGLGAGGTAPFAMVFQQSERAKQLGVLEAWNGISKIVAPVVGASIVLLSWDYWFLILFLLSLIAFIGIRCMVPLKGKIRT
jgi:MFS transporter, ACDE family, multidrug resistance protein